MALTQISTAGVKNDAVTAGKIPANAVGSSELADNAVDTAAIAADAVNGTKIANDSINSEHYVDGSIATAHIGASQVETANIANLNVTTGKLADSAVATAKIADQAVSLDKLPHGTSSNDGKFLRANNGADPTFETVTGTTINNNADNRVITGSGTANTLEGEATFTHNPSTYDTTIIHNANSPSDLIVQNDSSGTAANARLTIQSGSNANSGAMLQLVTGSDSWTLLTPKTAGALDFNDNGTLAFKMAGNGNFDVITGDVTINGSGKGIDFAQGANTGTAANILDEYEEGTFTPSLGYSTTQNNPTYTAQQGQYTKIGNVVTFQARINISNKGSGSGNVKVGGLPFGASTSGVSNQHVSANAIVGMDVGGDRNIFVQFEGSNSTNVFFYSFGIESSANYGALGQAEIDNNLQLNIRGTYFTS